ncbi:MAG: hypothetical protein R3B97_17340 [Dehalococcoidia bacterium]|nr:hypothetical protein [Dehalococcoidia bacterium]MCB9485927.1 hypothetical protein [Thermoflexaceae bacterium]
MQRTHLVAAIAATAAILALPAYSALGSVLDPGPAREASVLAAPTELTDSFTYQGRLTDNNQPASGAYDFRFIAYDAETGGDQVGLTVTKDDLPVSAGVFTTTLSLGPDAFNGDARWLEIAVRPGASTGTYTVLSPRQPISAVPYAIYAKTVGGIEVPFEAAGVTTGTGAVIAITQTGATATGFGLDVDGASGTGAKVAGDVAAIEIDGAIKVSGTNKAAFTATIDAGNNTCDLATADDDAARVIDNPFANDDPNALIFLTVSGGSVSSGIGYGVTYDSDGTTTFPKCSAGRWVVYSLDGSALDDNLKFNVLVIKQ